MPIQDEQGLVQSSELNRLPRWKIDYFEKIARALQVHTKGQLFSKVDTLFPNEHPDSKAHVLSSYEPITKGSIWKGINNILRIFSSSAFSINVGDELTKWLAEYEHEGHNLLNLFLHKWVHKAIAEDPNGLFVVYPPDYAEEKGFCPLQFIRSSLIRSKTENTIAFASEIDSEVQYEYVNTTTGTAVFLDPYLGGNLNSRDYTKPTYNERLEVKVIKEVVHLFTIDGFIIYKNNGGQKFETTIVNFAEPLSQLPVFPGGGPVVDTADQHLFESFVQGFVPFGNLALIQHRNHRAVDLQFSYPRMSELEIPCDYQGCNAGKITCLITGEHPDGRKDCPTCKGRAFITVQSPYKVYKQRYDPNDSNANEHLKTDPVKFYAPEVGIITYSKDAWKNYLRQAEEAIFVQQKVETGNVESAESKELDLDELYSWLLNISKVFYNNLRMVLQALEDYISRSPMKVNVEQPYSFAILTEGEAFVALNRILTSSAPILIKAERVENFVNKFVSKDSPINRALEVLKQYDELLFYSDSQVSSFKSANVISQEMYKKHVLGYPVFLRLYMKDKNIVFESDEAIIKQIDAEIAKLKIEVNGEAFRQGVLKAVEAA